MSVAELVLRPHQEHGKRLVHDEWRAGRRIVLFVMPTGGGKRYSGVWWAKRAQEQGKEVLIVTDRRILVKQMYDELHRFDVDYGVIMNGHEERRIPTVQVASIHTLRSRYFDEPGLPPADLIIVDECFPAGTLVDGRPIENIRRGSWVRSFNHLTGKRERRLVTSVFRRPAGSAMVTIHFSSGETLRCTASHPIYRAMDGRYVDAIKLKPGDAVFRECNETAQVDRDDLHSVRSDVLDPETNQADGKLLQPGVHRGAQISAANTDESNEDGSDKIEGVQHAPQDRPQANYPRRKRTWADISGGGDGDRPGMGVECSCASSDGQAQRIPDVLQNRRGEPDADGGSRDRRTQPPVAGAPAAGPEETSFLAVDWVAHIEIHQSADRRELESLCPGGVVYNLEVAGNNNYFANGVLVHNCHKELDAYQILFQKYPNAKIVGLTATPVGPQGRALVPSLYEVMVEGCRNSELIRDGLLLPMKVIAPSEPDIEGVQINGGKEFNQRRLSKRVASVTAFADVFKEWEPYADRQTIVFAPGVAYCRGLSGGFGVEGGGDSFWARGVESAVIHAATKQDERDRLLDRFNGGDLRVLCSVDVLREGFDAPAASCMIDLQPNSQLRTLWQKLGRVKRSHPGQTEAVNIDMAGNVWRHLIHPDDDPDWQSVTEDTSTGDLLEKRKAKANQPAAIRCPQCSTVRKGGAKCLDCGHVCQPKDAVRVVRMGNGKLKEIPLQDVQKAEVSAEQKILKGWKGELFVAMKTGRSLAQAKSMYFRRHGEWPPDNLPGMPPRGSVDWKRKVGDVFTAGSLMETFRKAGV